MEEGEGEEGAGDGDDEDVLGRVPGREESVWAGIERVERRADVPARADGDGAAAAVRDEGHGWNVLVPDVDVDDNAVAVWVEERRDQLVPLGETYAVQSSSAYTLSSLSSMQILSSSSSLPVSGSLRSVRTRPVCAISARMSSRVPSSDSAFGGDDSSENVRTTGRVYSRTSVGGTATSDGAARDEIPTPVKGARAEPLPRPSAPAEAEAVRWRFLRAGSR